MSGPAARPPSPVVGGAPSRPWWLGAAVIAWGLVWLYGALSLPQAATYAVVGPGLVPAAVGAGLVVLGLLLLLAVARGERFEPQEAEDVDAGRPPSRASFWMTVAAGASMVAYFIRNQKDIVAKVSKYKSTIADSQKRYDEIQTGWRDGKHQITERNLMVDGLMKNFIQTIDES